VQYKVDGRGEIVADMTMEKDLEETVIEREEKVRNSKKLQQINLFSKQVVDKMVKEGVPPSPSNFLVYFEKYLEEKAPAQKDAIQSVLELESSEDTQREYLYKIDAYLKQNDEKTKTLLNNVNTLYSKASKIINYIKVKGLELAKNPTKSSITTFDTKISQALSSLEKQQKEIKDDYLSIATLMKNFSKESIFDKKYEVYNKKYFFDMLSSELENMKNFTYKNSVIAFCVKKKVLNDVKLQSDRDIISRTIAKMILERSRRSDILSHYEDGVFLLMLKHTDFSQAQKAVDSIKNYVSFANFIIDGKQIQPKIDTFITEIKEEQSIDEIVGSSIEGLLNG